MVKYHDEIDTAFRDSEDWQVPLSEEGAKLQDMRRDAFYEGWSAAFENFSKGGAKLRNEDINSFVYNLTEFLNPMLPPEKHMGNFFDTNETYEPLRDFVHNELDKFIQQEDNYN